MKAGKRVLAVLTAFLFLFGYILQADAASFLDAGAARIGETSSAMGETERESRSAVMSEEKSDGTTKSSETETQKESQLRENTKKQETETQSETGTEQETSPETEKSSEAEKSQRASGFAGRVQVEITSPDDPELQKLVPDENFRQVIYDSLKAYGWLKGSSKNPPSSVQEILETYQGPINGAKDYNTPDEEKIRSIEGIQYFKIASTANRNYEIDLTGNLITDLMPVVEKCGPDDYYYGGFVYCEDRGGYGFRPVVMSFLDNPVRCIPKSLDVRFTGLLVFRDMTRGDIQYVEEEDLQYYFLREEKERFQGYLRIGFCQYESMEPDAEYVTITGLSVMGQVRPNANLLSKENSIIDTDVSVVQTDEGPNKNKNIDAKYTNVTKSCSPTIGVAMDECLVSMSTNISGVYIQNITSMAYTMLPVFTIFDRLQVTGEYAGSAQLQKVDQETGSALNGAEYSFYREGAEGEEDVLVKEGLVTATRQVQVYNEEKQTYETQTLPGYTEAISGLKAGTYYFKETKAPAGYQINPEKYTVVIEEMTPAVSGGLKNLDYTSADQSVIKESAGENETFLTWKQEEPVDFYLGDALESVDKETEALVVKSVELTYASLEGSAQAVTETYESLDQAETALNKYIKNNNITGAVKAKVIYDDNSAPLLKTVKATDQPLYTQVRVEKDWVGAGGDELLPEVTFKLYRAAGEEGEKEEINSFTIPAGTDREKYSHTFETDQNGKKLRTYTVDQDGNPVKYVYTIKEEFDSNQFVGGKPGEPETTTIYEELPEGGQIEVGTLITIPVSNYRVASIKVIKIDAKNPEKKLSDVEFKLEIQTEDGQWKEIARDITDERGEVQFKDLGSGEYRLTETKTQEGYILLKEPLLVSIGDLTEPDTDRDFVYTVKNSKMYGLPEAGGFGSQWYIWMGVILISLSGIIWIQKKKLTKK